MLPLKAFVDALQNTLWNSDCLVRACPFLDGRLEHHHPSLVLEKPPDRFNVQEPQSGDFRRRIVPFGGIWLSHRITAGKWGSHSYLPVSGDDSQFEIRSGAMAPGCCVSLGALLSRSGIGLGGRCWRRSDWRSLCAT